MGADGFEKLDMAWTTPGYIRWLESLVFKAAYAPRKDAG
jgi:hypothetical protein